MVKDYNVIIEKYYKLIAIDLSKHAYYKKMKI